MIFLLAVIVFGPVEGFSLKAEKSIYSSNISSDTRGYSVSVGTPAHKLISIAPPSSDRCSAYTKKSSYSFKSFAPEEYSINKPTYAFTAIEKVPVLNGSEPVAKQSLIELAAATRGKDGCKVFKIYQTSSNNSTTYMMYQNWNSSENYTAYLNSEQYKKFQSAEDNFTSGEIDVLKSNMITSPQNSQLNSSMVSTISIMYAKPGKITKAKDALLDIVKFARSHSEWNAAYDLHQGTDDPSMLICHENWRNMDAVNAYLATPEFNDFISQKDDLFVDGAIEVNFCQLIE
jgi:quinol monooxygenase YgiN